MNGTLKEIETELVALAISAGVRAAFRRTKLDEQAARWIMGKEAQAIVGLQGTVGGHDMIAGGQVSLGDRDAEQVVSHLREHALQYLEVDRTVRSKPLIHPAS